MPAVFSVMVGVWAASGRAARAIEGMASKQSWKRHRERFSIFGASEWRERFTTKDGWRGGKSRLLYLDEIASISKLNKLRISIVQYLNTAPLVRGFTHGPLRGKYQLSFTVPSQCAEALRSGAVDIAIIPAIEFQRIANLVVLPNLSVASKKSVRSLLLVSKKPIQEIRRIAL